MEKRNPSSNRQGLLLLRGAGSALGGLLAQLLPNSCRRKNRPVSLSVRTSGSITAPKASDVLQIPLVIHCHPVKAPLFSREETAPFLLTLQTLLIVRVTSRASPPAVAASGTSLLESQPFPHFHPCWHKGPNGAGGLSVQYMQCHTISTKIPPSNFHVTEEEFSGKGL